MPLEEGVVPTGQVDARENGTMPSLSLVFAGSPAAAVPSLRRLAASDHSILSVITREDSAQGRRGILTPTAAAAVADELAIPTIKANRLNGTATDAVTSLAPDLGVIVAYGGLVREPLLSVPRLGWINLHFSLLPRWRGAAPVQRAIIAGDDLTGASVFQLVPELDAGDVFGQVTQGVGPLETAGHLLESLADGGAELLLRVVDGLADGTARAEPQVGDITLAPKLSQDDGRINWTRDAASITNQIRGVTPEPGAFTSVDGARLKVLAAAIAHDLPPLAPGTISLSGRRVVVGTETDPVELISVHPAGRKAMAASDWWRGRGADSSGVAS
ncbi:MAG: methionyl-tRNA formyltransferase [Glaciihabitans sp.]|nr:methionyl-tRNA formyltransferase [Glaciihabitans sp.]